MIVKNVKICLCCSGAQEVVMLDREPIALQCSLLSAQACGLESVEDYRLHPTPLAVQVVSNQQEPHQQSLQPLRQQNVDHAEDASRLTSLSAPQPQVRMSASQGPALPCPALPCHLRVHRMSITSSCSALQVLRF